MPRQAGTNIENNFVKGLITDSTGLNFPENAAEETMNCVFNVEGNVTRRLGVDYEVGAAFHNLAGFGVPQHYVWRTVAGDGNLTLAVVQKGENLHFYRSQGSALSAGYITTVNLAAWVAPGATLQTLRDNECQFTEGKGRLYVTNPAIEPVYISYNQGTNSFSIAPITVNIRDFKGVEDGYTTEFRPSSVGGLSSGSLTDAHHYNLLNQGWRGGLGKTADRNPIGSQDRIGFFGSSTGVWPSNADVWWFYKGVNSSNGNPEFDPPNMLRFVNRGNSPAPKGYYILNAFNLDRAGVSLLPVPGESSGGARPSCNAFFAGRLFLGGVSAPGYNSNIYFTQILEDVDKQINNFHQQNDPTCESPFDLLPSDGGVISIPEMGTLFKIFPFQNYLLFFANNGIWAATGSSGIGFSATDYTIKRIASLNQLSASSFVDASGTPMWWTDDGIWTIATSADGPAIKSITNKSQEFGGISKYFEEVIPSSSKYFASGAYDFGSKTVHWLWRSSPAGSLLDQYKYDRILVYDVVLNAFYPWSLPSDAGGIYLNGVLALRGSSSEPVATPVTAGGVTVTADGQTVTTQVAEIGVVSPVFKYSTIAISGINNIQTFSEFYRENYLDWFTQKGVLADDYSSFFTTGYKVHGDAQRKFQSNYVYLYFDRKEENCRFFFRGRRNFAKLSSSNEFSMRIFVDRTVDAAHEYSWVRHKVRGTGVVLQLHFFSQKGQPFNIIGWSIFETQNAGV